MTASETINVGNLVNIYSSGGAYRTRNARSYPAGYEAMAFCTQNVKASATGNIALAGINSNVVLTGPNVLYLSNIAGQVTSIPPVTSGNIVQRVGVGLASTVMYFNPQTPISIS
jgi:hypothetical protein